MLFYCLIFPETAVSVPGNDMYMKMCALIHNQTVILHNGHPEYIKIRFYNIGHLLFQPDQFI